MRLRYISLYALSSFLFCFTSATNVIGNLTFGYITTITGGFIASGGIPIVDMALQQINSRDDILQNYSLVYKDVLDSGCNQTKSLDAFFELINSNTTYVALTGCGCSPATIPVAEISHYWNIPQIAFVAAASVLNERYRFRNFFRTLPTWDYIAASLAQLARKFEWRKMLVVTQQESLFTGVTNSLSSIFSSEAWDFQQAPVKTGETPFPYGRIFDLIEKEHYRIIHINSYATIAYNILCEAYYRNIHAPQYVWILPLWYDIDYLTGNASNGNTSCTSDKLIKVLNGTLGIVPDGYLLEQNKTLQTFSTLTPQMFTNNYTALLKLPQYQNLPELSFAGVAYDAVWSMAIGLDRATKKIAKGNDSGCENIPGDLVPLEYFNYTNEKLGCIMRQSFSEVQFIGVTGSIKFNENGSRPDNTLLIRQYRLTSDGFITQQPIGYVVIKNNNDTFYFANGESDSTVWINGAPPYDGYVAEVIDKKSLPLFIIYIITAAAGILFAIVCFIFNIVFRNRKVIKIASPNLNYLIIFGATMLYVCVLFVTFPTSSGTVQTIFCNLQVWLFALGYNLCFAVILSKTWRIYYIFNNPKPQKKAIKDWVLFLIVLVIVAIDLTILLLGSAIPQSRLTSSRIPDIEHLEAITDEGKFIKNFIFVCTRPESTIWLSLSFGYKALLQLIAVFMAFHTRRVKVKALNDSKEIAAIIYINSIILALLVVTEFVLVNYQNIYAAMFGLGLLIAGSLFLGLMFIPKMVNLYRDPEGVNVLGDTVAPAPTFVTQYDVTAMQNNSDMETIRNLQEKIRELELQLNSGTIQSSEVKTGTI